MSLSFSYIAHTFLQPNVIEAYKIYIQTKSWTLNWKTGMSLSTQSCIATLHVVFNVLQILTHIYFNHQLEETIDLHTERNICIRRWNCINGTKIKVTCTCT